MPQRVTDRINAMGLHDKQPKDIIIGDRNDQQTVDDFNLGIDENEDDMMLLNHHLIQLKIKM
jgi:hypothetical protein